MNEKPERWRFPRHGEDVPPGCDVVYEDEEGTWYRINARLWIAPNGDTVSVRSMTPARRNRLSIAEEDLLQRPNADAIRHLRVILDP